MIQAKPGPTVRTLDLTTRLAASEYQNVICRHSLDELTVTLTSMRTFTVSKLPAGVDSFSLPTTLPSNLQSVAALAQTPPSGGIPCQLRPAGGSSKLSR